MKHSVPTNEEKQAVHEAMRDRKAIRVPLNWSANTRVVVLLDTSSSMDTMVLTPP